MAELDRTERRLNRKKLKAFTLLESVVAITILSILIGLGTSIYTNVLKSEDPMVYHKALLELDRCYHNLTINENWEDNYYEYEGFSVQQKVTLLEPNKSDDLYKITFRIIDNYSNELHHEQHLMLK